MFKIPCQVYNGATCNVPAQSNLAKYLKEMDVGIIDEGPMMNKESFECLDRTLRHLTGNHREKFGGKLILVSGDFRQMLPVVKRGGRASVVGACLKSSADLWDDEVTVLGLTENMRVQKYINAYPDDSDFHSELRQFEKWLLDLGDGKASVSEKHDDIVEIPKNMAKESREEVLECIFGDLGDNFGKNEYFKSRLLLAADNTIVNETNFDMVQKLPGELHTFKSTDKVDDDDQRLEYPVEFLNLLNPSGISEHELHLKKGAPVVLLRNFDIKAGHCNGTRYIIKEIYRHRLELEKLDPNGDEDDILQLPRIPMIYNPDNMPMIANVHDTPSVSNQARICCDIPSFTRSICRALWYPTSKRYMDAWSNLCSIFAMWQSSQHICLGGARERTFSEVENEAWSHVESYEERCISQGFM
jgi:ATP-dependent DNA helicase PIF1